MHPQKQQSWFKNGGEELVLALVSLGAAGAFSYVKFVLPDYTDSSNLGYVFVIVCCFFLAIVWTGRAIAKMKAGRVSQAGRRVMLGIAIAGLVLAGAAVWLLNS